jgi:hypothetical protein
MANGDETNAPGPASDASGNPVFDPSKNVLDLVEAAIARQDDLRVTESEHVREIMRLRASYDHELRVSETARIDAIRAVDVGTAERAAAVVASQAATLATTVTASAEALRTQNEVARVQVADQLRSALEPILKDVSELRRVQYETAGGKAETYDQRTERFQGGVIGNGSVAIFISCFAAFLTIIGLVLVVVLHG